MSQTKNNNSKKWPVKKGVQPVACSIRQVIDHIVRPWLQFVFLKNIFLNFFRLVVVRVVFIWAFLCFGFLRQGLPCSQSWPRTCGFRRCKTSLPSWAVLPQPLELWDIGLIHYVLIWLFWDLKKFVCVCDVYHVCVMCLLSPEEGMGSWSWS